MRVDKAPPAGEEDYRVEDALRTLSAAEEIKDDAALMKKVRALAADKAEDFSHIAAGSLAKRGLISDKQAERLKRSAAKDD